MTGRDDDHETSGTDSGTERPDGETDADARRTEQVAARLSALETAVASTRDRQERLIATVERLDGTVGSLSSTADEPRGEGTYPGPEGRSTDARRSSVGRPDARRSPSGSERRRESQQPLLAELPAGYAADAIVMEWLSGLVADVGPAGALHALEYYADVHWISESVRDGLLDVLAGTELDFDVDPNRPVEPDAVNHTESYQYVETLAALREP